jgi:hypothetical protein
MRKTNFLAISLLAFTMISLSATAQDAPPAPQQGGQGRMGGPGMEGRGTGGVIKEIKPGVIVLEGRDGKAETVNIGSGTNFRKDGQAAKFEDFKVGDRVLVMGERKGEAWDAQMIASGNRGGGMQMNREDMGKKFIAGEVTKIEETKLTIHRMDGVDQVIEVDETTSFRNSKRESITLADVKVGDKVAGRGELKDGTFVPAVLNVGDFPMMRPREGGPGTQGGAGAPPSNPGQQQK